MVLTLSFFRLLEYSHAVGICCFSDTLPSVYLTFTKFGNDSFTQKHVHVFFVLFLLSSYSRLFVQNLRRCSTVCNFSSNSLFSVYREPENILPLSIVLSADAIGCLFCSFAQVFHDFCLSVVYSPSHLVHPYMYFFHLSKPVFFSDHRSARWDVRGSSKQISDYPLLFILCRGVPCLQSGSSQFIHYLSGCTWQCKTHQC